MLTVADAQARLNRSAAMATMETLLAAQDPASGLMPHLIYSAASSSWDGCVPPTSFWGSVRSIVQRVDVCHNVYDKENTHALSFHAITHLLASLTRTPVYPSRSLCPPPRLTSRKKGTLASGLAAPPMHATVALRIYNYSIGSGEELAALVGAGARFFAGPVAYALTGVPTTIRTPCLW
jgi:hypothetical protein